jgi:putative flippase GtrA
MEEKSIIKRVWSKVVTKETISYAIVGGLTTVVNLVSFDILCNKLGWNELIGNVIAWLLAVTFAYVTNNLFVFGSGVEEKAKEISKILKFFGARLVTLGIEELGLLIFVSWLAFPNMIVKLGLAVIVIVVNYLFSKLYIFNKKK